MAEMGLPPSPTWSQWPRCVHQPHGHAGDMSAKEEGALQTVSLPECKFQPQGPQPLLAYFQRWRDHSLAWQPCWDRP